MFRYRFRLESNKSIKKFLDDNKLDYTPVSYILELQLHIDRCISSCVCYRRVRGVTFLDVVYIGPKHSLPCLIRKGSFTCRQSVRLFFLPFTNRVKKIKGVAQKSGDIDVTCKQTVRNKMLKCYCFF